MRYLENRGILETKGRKVWEFVGDGEMDEPESLAALSLAARERLDNLIFVVNCNCSASTARCAQRPDHPGVEGRTRAPAGT